MTCRYSTRTAGNHILAYGASKIVVDPDETYSYLERVRLSPENTITIISTPSKIYMQFHLDAGVFYPTFDQGLQAEMCKPDVQQEITDDDHIIRLDPLLRLHSRWIARKLAEVTVNEPDPEVDYSGYEGFKTEGSWLDDIPVDSD